MGLIVSLSTWAKRNWPWLLLPILETLLLKFFQIQRLKKKSGQIIAGSYERQIKRSLDAEDLKTQDALVNADQLRDFLKKKYQVD
jgi:hypothetical protein